MQELFSFLPEALKNTEKIAEQCQLDLELGKIKLPSYQAPHPYSVSEYLEKLCLENLKKSYHDPSSQAFYRMKYELEVINQMGFAGYFLIVSDFIKHGRDIGVFIGPGRGSAAGSAVAYCIGITNIDPIKYNLLFERFLNPERISMPDIDVDFCKDGREDVIRYVTEKYGDDKVAQIITFGTMKSKAAVRDVGRALGIPYAEVDKLSLIHISEPTRPY